MANRNLKSLFKDWGTAYDQWRPYSKHRVYINEGIFGSPLLAFAASLQQVEIAIAKKGSSADIKKTGSSQRSKSRIAEEREQNI